MTAKAKTIFYSLLVTLMFAASKVSAQARGLVGCGGTGPTECKIGDLFLVVIALINYLLSLAGFVAMVFIVWAGWSMVVAGGNEEKIEGAKAAFSDAIIGFFLLLIAYLLIDAIINILSGSHLVDYYSFIKSSP